jgi:hypothetical protein
MSKFASVLAGLMAFVAMGVGAHATYWNVFNEEGESTLSAAIVTYATRTDMLNDTNRLAVYQPNSFGFGANVVDSGSDGKTYWNVFNEEGESTLSAAIVTYASLNDMLNDTNRLAVYQPNSFGFGANVVGSGSDGTEYWNIFNKEGESTLSAAIVTYADLTDMLNDTNRLGTFLPNSFGFGANVVGGGSDSFAVISPPPDVPEPGGLGLTGLLLAFAFGLRRHRPQIL